MIRIVEALLSTVLAAVAVAFICLPLFALANSVFSLGE